MDITNDFIDLNCTTNKCKIASISKFDGNCTVIQELIVNEDGSTSEIKTKNKNVNSTDANGINTQAANVSLNKEVNENRMAIDIADIVPLDKGFDENKVITDTAAVKNNDIMIQFIGTKEDVSQNGSIEIENKGLKDTDVCNDIAVPETPLNLTVDNRIKNRISINLNSNIENKETGTEEPTMIAVLSTENHTKSNSTTVKGSVSQSPFKEYLFWPQNKLNDTKIKKSKYQLPHVETAAEWRSWHIMRNEQKQKDEERKAEMKLQRQNNIKIKEKAQENLSRIKTEKVRIQTLLKELHSTFQRNKTEQKLLQLELKSELVEEKKLSLNRRIKNLAEKISENSIRKEELLKIKQNVIEEERNIKRQQNINKKPITKNKNALIDKENFLLK